MTLSMQIRVQNHVFDYDKMWYKENYHDMNHDVILTQVRRADHEMEYLQMNIHSCKRVFLHSEII